MARTLVVLNCRLPTPRGEIASGVVVIQHGRIAAAGQDRFLAIPADAILIDARRGRVGMASAGSEALQPLTVGASADLVCLTDKEEIAWILQRGQLIHPAGQITEAVRQEAVQRARRCLEARPEHRRIEAVIPPTDADLAWTFRDDGSEATLTLRALPALTATPGHLLLLDPDGDAPPDWVVHRARAHWGFFWHPADARFYCLPLPALRRWWRRQARNQPRITLADASLSGRLIPVERLQEAIPAMRILPCSDEPDAAA